MHDLLLTESPCYSAGDASSNDCVTQIYFCVGDRIKLLYGVEQARQRTKLEAPPARSGTVHSFSLKNEGSPLNAGTWKIEPSILQDFARTHFPGGSDVCLEQAER